MRLDLPPSGTHGSEIPKAVRPITKALFGLGGLMFRLGVKVQGRPLLRLTTVGARTGKSRVAILGWFPDDNDPEAWLVVGSNGGSARHPGWAHNLVSGSGQAIVDVGDGPMPVSAELLQGTERESAWNRVIDMAPGYGSYTTKTDREIPIFRLVRRP